LLFGRNRKSRSREDAGRRNYPEAVPNGEGRNGDNGPKRVPSVAAGSGATVGRRSSRLSFYWLMETTESQNPNFSFNSSTKSCKSESLASTPQVVCQEQRRNLLGS